MTCRAVPAGNWAFALRVKWIDNPGGRQYDGKRGGSLKAEGLGDGRLWMGRTIAAMGGSGKGSLPLVRGTRLRARGE
jgi:hypothetical protein